jgi:predicted acyl esterase
MKLLLKNLRDKVTMRTPAPLSADAWYHPANEAFWPSLRLVQCVNEHVEVFFDGALNINAIKFFSGILTGEQQLEWEARKKRKNVSYLNLWQNRRLEELPWYHPHNDHFWGQISDVRMSAKETVIVFQRQALHDGFRLLVRERKASVSAPAGNFLMTSCELSAWVQESYDKHSESAMFDYWAKAHPELLDHPDWRQYIVEQARIENEFVKRQEQLKTVINDAFSKPKQ